MPTSARVLVLAKVLQRDKCGPASSSEHFLGSLGASKTRRMLGCVPLLYVYDVFYCFGAYLGNASTEKEVEIRQLTAPDEEHATFMPMKYLDPLNAWKFPCP